MDGFFERCVEWQRQHGRSNGRVHEPGIVENTLSPLLGKLSLHLKAVLSKLKNQEEISELSAMAEKYSLLAEELDAVVSQKMPDAVYWMEIGGRVAAQRQPARRACERCPGLANASVRKSSERHHVLGDAVHRKKTWPGEGARFRSFICIYAVPARGGGGQDFGVGLAV